MLLGALSPLESVLALAAFAFWLWMLIDCLLNPTFFESDKIVWVLILLALNLLGAIIYFFAVKRRRA